MPQSSANAAEADTKAHACALCVAKHTMGSVILLSAMIANRFMKVLAPCPGVSFVAWSTTATANLIVISATSICAHVSAARGATWRRWSVRVPPAPSATNRRTLAAVWDV